MSEIPNIVEAGVSELALRNQLGDAGCEAWKARAEKLAAYEDERAAISVADAEAHKKLAKAQAAYFSAKAQLIGIVSAAVFIGLICGVIEFTRWIAR